MKDFQNIDWKLYNRPPFYQQWLCRDDTLKLATFGDKGLADVDNQILALKDQWDLDNVKGHFLDRIGKLLNESRNGNTDDHYRILLKLRRLLNTNNGSIPSIIEAIKFIYSSEVVHIVPNYPAGLVIEHDGEGTPGLNFNKLLAEIIPAGVSFNTKELFYFTETIDFSELIQIIIRRKDPEYFGNPLKYNGMIKYDGHTANDRIAVRGRYDGQCKYNSDLSYDGTGRIPASYQPSPPFRYSSGIFDRLAVTFQDENFIDTHRARLCFDGSVKYNGAAKYAGVGSQSINDPVMVMEFGKSLADTETINETQAAVVIADQTENTLKQIRFSGKIKYNGKFCYSHDYVDKLVMETPGGDVTDQEQMNDEIFVGMRKHHHFNGAYAYKGLIKYDGMALIPLG